MSRKIIREETKEVLSPVKVAGLVVGLVFVIIALAISIYNTSGDRLNNITQDGVKESSVEKNETSPSIDVSRPDLSYILHLVGPFVK